MDRLLVVDDEEVLAKGLQSALEAEGYQVEVAYDGQQAWDKLQVNSYDLLVLDVMLPKIDGFSLCKMIRKTSEIPIIMLTARGEDIDKIVGLELGADDYMAKPFNTRELLARIRAILRRVVVKSTDQATDFLKRGDMAINLVKRKVMVRGQEIDLTAKEFDLLALMAQHPGRVYTRDQLLELVWGFDFVGDDRTVDVHVRRLREKVEPNPAQPRFVLTKWGVGYYFVE